MSGDLPTGEQCEAVVIAALDAHDMQGVDAALTVMAVVDPHRAERVLETLRLGVALAGSDTEDREGQP